MKRALAERAKLAEANTTSTSANTRTMREEPSAAADTAVTLPVPKKIVLENATVGIASMNLPVDEPYSKSVAVAAVTESSSTMTAKDTSNAENTNVAVPSSTSASVAVSVSASVPAVSTTPSTSTPALIRGSKRRKQQQEDEAGEPDGWFLKFQNKALVAELRSLQSELKDLIEERDARRAHSLTAMRGMHMVELRWREMEEILRQLALLLLQQRTGNGADGFQLSDCDRSILEQAANSSVDDGTRHISTPSLVDNIDSPSSTGSGDMTENIPALLYSLARLAKSSLSLVSTPENNEKITQQYNQETIGNDMKAFSTSLSARTKFLCDTVSAILRSMPLTNSSSGFDLFDAKQLRQDILALKADIAEKENTVKQIILARDEALMGQKRARRALNRIAAGADISEVLKDADDITKSSIEVEAEKEVVKPEPATSEMKTTQTPSISDAEVAKKVSDLEALCESKEKRIVELLDELKTSQLRINELIIPTAPPSPGTVEKSKEYLEIKKSLLKSESSVLSLTEKQQRALKGWAETKGSLELAQKTANELQSKHDRRWKEITGELDEDDGEVTEKDMKGEHEIAIEHKLRQALEAVRMNDSTKSSLKEAQELVETLQTEVNDWKTKYEGIIANSIGEENSSVSVPTTPLPESSTKSQTQPRDRDAAYDKLKRDNSKLRKEVQTAHSSREGLKGKLERAEARCESFVKQNARLLKQSREKDEVNATALSSILHLKHLAELHKEEKDLMDKKIKSAEQLALSARLLTNAKDRVDEELKKEKELLQEKIDEATSKHNELLEENAVCKSTIKHLEGKIEGLEKEILSVSQRCHELVGSTADVKQEKSRLLDALAVAEKEIKKYSESMEGASSRGKKRSRFSDSKFTREDLETTIETLMKRLSCPVCDFGQKECMVTTCRHMFCKKCIDKNIKNRNRKCPACGNRFDAKDIADVFL
jgi:E3 ubiquitin-protein ligase BRE1